MIRRLALFLFLSSVVLYPLGASAQNTPVYQNPNAIQTGRVPYWISNGVIGDGGPAAAGNITELGITNTGLPFCIDDTLQPNPTNYHQFCAGALALGGGLMNYQAYGSATQLPFTVSVGGPLVLSSGINNIQAKNLPVGGAGAVQLCVNPTTGTLSIASGGVMCGGGAPPAQYVLLQGGSGYVLLQGGAGRILLQ